MSYAAPASYAAVAVTYAAAPTSHGMSYADSSYAAPTYAPQQVAYAPSLRQQYIPAPLDGVGWSGLVASR
jgi:hypothetical protein